MIPKDEYYKAIVSKALCKNVTIEDGQVIPCQDCVWWQSVITVFEKENFKPPVKSDDEALKYILDVFKNNGIIK
jgi:hypothetical protein